MGTDNRYITEINCIGLNELKLRQNPGALYVCGLTTSTSPMDKNGDARDFGFKDPIKGMPAPSPRRRDKLPGLLDIVYVVIHLQY
ncbi:hypothetical protein Hanom_Chr03g00225361 [Helianthus anomalus]